MRFIYYIPFFISLCYLFNLEIGLIDFVRWTEKKANHRHCWSSHIHIIIVSILFLTPSLWPSLYLYVITCCYWPVRVLIASQLNSIHTLFWWNSINLLEFKKKHSRFPMDTQRPTSAPAFCLNYISQSPSLWFEYTGPLPILRTEYVQRVSKEFLLILYWLP